MCVGLWLTMVSLSFRVLQYVGDVLEGRRQKGVGTAEDEVVLRDTVMSIGRYFDRALGLLLLYKQERLQVCVCVCVLWCVCGVCRCD